MTAVASYLIALRKNANKTQEEAADIIGIATKTVQRWEGAENEPKFSELAPYVEALGGSAYRLADYLLGRLPPLGDAEEEKPGVLAARLRLANLPSEAVEMLAPIADQMMRGEKPR